MKKNQKEKMKICLLANVSSIHTQRWARFFSERHDVHIISFERPNIELENINIHMVDTNKKYLYLSFLYKSIQFRKILDDIKPDIVHAHYVTKYGIIGALTGFHPFIVSVWGSDINLDSKKWYTRIATKFALKNADCVHCDGDSMKEECVLLVPTQKIKIVGFGTDIKKFKPKSKNENIIKELGISNFPVAISFRDLEPLYDIESLIRSVPLVLNEVPEAKFIICGGGSQEEKLKNLANSIGVSNSIKFTGHIANNLLEYIVSADVYVSTSLSDGGIASSTTEAMACGLPVIITDFGDNRKWVEDGINGFIVPLKNPKILADRLIYLFKNEKLRTAFGKINRKIIEERNNYYTEMRKMENIYNELIEVHRL